MWTCAARIRQVADGTFMELTGVALQIYRLRIVICFSAGQDGVGAVVAGFAVDPIVAG